MTLWGTKEVTWVTDPPLVDKRNNALSCTKCRKRIELRYWNWWKSLEITHVRIAAHQVRVLKQFYSFKLKEKCFFFSELLIDFHGDFLHVRCLEFDRSWVGLCIEGTIYLHHMQWNSPKSRCTSISSKVSEAWYVDRRKAKGKLDKKFGFQYVEAGGTFSCNLTWT